MPILKSRISRAGKHQKGSVNGPTFPVQDLKAVAAENVRPSPANRDNELTYGSEIRVNVGCTLPRYLALAGKLRQLSNQLLDLIRKSHIKFQPSSLRLSVLPAHRFARR